MRQRSLIPQHKTHQLLGDADLSREPRSGALLPIKRVAQVRGGYVSSVHVDHCTTSSDTTQYPSDEMATDAFSDWLTGRMERKGWNQSDLSVAAGIHKANISAWIRGRNRPSPEQIRALCSALDASAEEAFRVLGWLDTPTSLTPAQADLIETIRRAALDRGGSHRA